jgi:hypothetical protein
VANLALFDKTIFDAVNASEEEIEQKLDCDLFYFYGEIRSDKLIYFRNFLEDLAQKPGKKEAVGICLTTPGGEAEAVEQMAAIVRHHWARVYFIVPMTALSAGTIFCMSGDKIYMDYSSSLGPIDPQVPDKEGKYLVPALGYLDKVEELVEKSTKGTISPGELAILVRQDLAMLRFYEQARDLSKALLKDWLTKYKFKDWATHRTTNPGTPVTDAEKTARAEQIAAQLSDNRVWHSHGRMIGMNKLKDLLRLEIDDFGADQALRDVIRRYCDTLTDYLGRHGHAFYMHNRKVTL